MTRYIDFGGYSWTACAKMKYRPAKEIWKDVHKAVQNGDMFCMDSQHSIRKKNLPWYKANRIVQTPETEHLRACAWEFQNKFIKLYPDSVVAMSGLEADDLCALMASPTDWIMSTDKDLLTLTEANLVDLSGIPWGIERIKTKLPVAQGNRWVTYQLLFGDPADNIQRLLPSKDIYSAKIIFQSANPLEAAISYLPPGLVRQHLQAICLPTPLYAAPHLDPIDWALAQYPCPDRSPA